MHHAAWVIAPLVLAGVLALGAVAKRGKGESLQSVVANLELPAWVLPRPLARAVPGLELLLAVGLLAPWPAVFAVAAGAALLLMVVYWTLIARGLTITPRPSCDCFGAVGNHEITGRTLLRNTLLVAAAAAAVALAGSGRTAGSLLGGATRGDWLWLGLAALACLLTWLALAPAPSSSSTEAEGSHRGQAVPPPSARADGEAGLDTAAGQPVDDEHDEDYVRVPTPSITLHDPERSRPVTLLEVSRTRAQLLVFVNCYCHSTKQVMAHVADWDARTPLVDVRMVFSVPIAEKLVGAPPPRTLLDHSGLVWAALGLTRSPSAVLLGVDGYLAGGPVDGTDQVWAFVDEVHEALLEVPADADEPGDPAPADAAALTSDR